MSRIDLLKPAESSLMPAWRFARGELRKASAWGEIVGRRKPPRMFCRFPLHRVRCRLLRDIDAIINEMAKRCFGTRKGPPLRFIFIDHLVDGVAFLPKRFELFKNVLGKPTVLI